MRRSRFAIVAALALASAPAEALLPGDFTVRTTRDLLGLCSVDEEDLLHRVARGFCLGYLDAVWDYHQALTAGPGFAVIACPGPEVTRDQVADALIDWADAESKTLDTEAPVEGVMRAMARKWPCARQ